MEIKIRYRYRQDLVSSRRMQQLHRLCGQWHRMGLPHLHPSGRDGPGRRLKVKLAPCRLDDLGRTREGEPHGNRMAAFVTGLPENLSRAVKKSGIS